MFRQLLIATAVAGLLACGDREAGEGQASGAAPAEQPAAATNPLLNPSAPEMNETAPATFRTRFETSKGSFTIEVTRAWAPNGADRFYNLVKNGFYDEARFFRVIPEFVVQFGINGDPQVSARWRGATIQDDPVTQRNQRGTVTFAKTRAPNSRTTQLFINLGNNTNLDATGFAPFGRVVEGMAVVDGINSEYGDAPSGQQAMIQQQGNAFLAQQYPNLDYIRRATIVQ